MLWQTFHGNEEAMAQAMSLGDVYEKKGFYHFNTVKTGRRKEGSNNMQTASGEVELTSGEQGDLKEYMKARPFAQAGGDFSFRQLIDGGEATPMPQAAIMDTQSSSHTGYSGPGHLRIEMAVISFRQVEKPLEEAKADISFPHLCLPRK